MHCKLLIVSALVANCASAALIGEATTADGGVFAGACAGTFLGSRPNPGVSAANFFGGTMTCQTNSSVAGGATSASAASSGAVNGYPYANNASAWAAPGVLHAGSFNDGSSATAFSGAIAEVGFNDRVTLGGGVGSGYWVLPFQVSGMMTVTGPAALGVFQIGLYKDHGLVSIFNGGSAYSTFAGLNAHNYGDGSENTQAEMMTYTVTSAGVSSLAINNISYFVVPVTFGVSFEYALHANAAAGEGTNAGFFLGQNQTTVDFTHTISYAGGAYFIGSDNSVITNLTYSSAAGFDYQNPATDAVPEPATWVLSGLAVAMTAAVRRSRR